MAETIDSLQIEINAKAQTANDAIDALADKLDILSNSLGKLNNVRLDNFFNSLKGFQGNKLPDFARLANGISKLSNINYNEILNAGQSLRQIASQLQSLGGIKLDDNVMQIANVANAMSKLGGKSIVNATSNVPLLANALNQLMVTLSKAPTVNQSVIDMTNALANLAAQGSKVGSASKAVVNGLNRTNTAAKRASGSTMSLARAFGKFYANYFLLVRGFKGMFNMMESAMELTETVNYFEVTLRNIGENARENWKEYGYESADAYADSFAERLRESNEKLTGFAVSETGQISQSVFSGLGISPATATQYSAMFAQVANSIGMTEEASIALSEAFVRLGADWASLRNVDFEVAYEKLASGLSGQSRALRAFGLDITVASLQSIAFANGIEKSVSEMTQSEKAYLRLIAIIEQSEVAFGDLANTLASPANQMRMLSQGIQNLGTLIGNLFLPILSKTLPVLNGFVIAMQRIVIAISEAMGIDTSGFNTSLGGMDEGFGDLSDSVDEATESAEKFNRATRGWDELNVLGKDTSKGYGVGNDLVENEQLLDAYDKAIEKYRKAWNEAYEKINNEAEGFADRLLHTLNVDKIVDNFTDLAESVGNIYDAVAPFLGGAVSGFSETTFGFFKTLADFAGDVAENADPSTMEAVGDAVGTIIANLLLYKGVSSITDNFIKGIKGIGTALKAHPILSTFVLAAGVIELASLPEKIQRKDAEEYYSDLIEKIDEAGIAVENYGKKVEDAKTDVVEMENVSSLEHAFKKWSELALKSENLTEQEKRLLKAYEERLVDVLPSAKELIEDNVGAYEDVIKKVEELKNAEVERLKLLSYENYLSLSLDLEVEGEKALKDAEDAFASIYEVLRKEFPNIPTDQFEQIIDFYGNLDENILQPSRASFFNYVNPSGKYEEFNLVDYLGDKKEAAEVFTLIRQYVEAEKTVIEQGEYLEKQRANTKWALEQISIAQKDNNKVTSDGVEENNDLQSSLKDTETTLDKVKGVLGELGEKFSETWEMANTDDKLPTREVEELDENTQGAVKAFAALIDLFKDFSNSKIIGDVDSITKSFEKAQESIEELNKSIDLLNGKKITLPTIESIESKLTLPSSVVSGITSSTLKSSAVADLLERDMAASQQQNVNVTFDVKGDPNGLFTVVQQKANQYTYSTGRSAFK